MDCTPLGPITITNHTRDKQIGLPLRGRPILFITGMITDRIWLNSVLLPLQIERKGMFINRYETMGVGWKCHFSPA